MRRPADAFIPAVILIAAAPAMAAERAVAVDIAAAPAGKATRNLARQTGVSIGFRDPQLLRLPVRAIRGRWTVDAALNRMFADTPAQARRVAPDSYMIEMRPKALPSPPVARPRRAPRHLPASPPPPTPGEDREILVTASKRRMPLAFYPGGIQVLTGDSVSMADAAHGTDLIEARAASVTSTHLGPGRNKLFIRGIADSSIVGPTQATVGQYWGNSRVTYSAPDPNLRLYDVAQIEVLEGPQGTLYGAGSVGGVVRVVPNAPDLIERGGRIWGGASATQHGAPGGDGGAIVNLPIVDGRLALRALAFAGLDGGYIDDRQRRLNDINTVRTIGGRAALRFVPDDRWTIDLSVLGQRIVGDDSQYADRGGDGLTRASSIAQPYRHAYWLTELVAARHWGDIELTSSLSYAQQRVLEVFEGAQLADPMQPAHAPGPNAPPTAYTQDDRIRMLSGEVRLARRGPDGTGWLIAATVMHNSARIRRQMGEERGGRSSLTGVSNTIDEQALYGEYALKLVKGITVTAGGRLARSRLSGNSQDVAPEIGLRNDPNAVAVRHDTRLLPSGSIAYRPTDAVTLFTRFQQGFRPGGIAIRQDFVQRFRGDRVETTEAGVRYDGKRVKSSVSLSWTRWLDIQADLIDGFGFPTTANIGDGRVLTIGWSGQWTAAPGLDIEAAAYANDSHVVRPVQDILSLVPSGISLDRLPNVAHLSGRLGIAYTTRINDRDRIDLRGYGRYIGKSILGVGSILGREQGNYVDTGMDVRIGDARRALTLTASNLLDVRGNRFALGSPFLIRDHDQITPLQPRTIRIGYDLAF